MRKWIYRFGWCVLFVLPILYVAEIVVTQDLPLVAPWQWGVLTATVVLLYFSRDTDEVLRHRVV
jgi:hypothetical protein